MEEEKKAVEASVMKLKSGILLNPKLVMFPGREEDGKDDVIVNIDNVLFFRKGDSTDSPSTSIFFVDGNGINVPGDIRKIDRKILKSRRFSG